MERKISGLFFLSASVLHLSFFAFAQQRSALPVFEVATIEPAQADANGPIIGISTGTVHLTGFTLKDLIVYAYWIHASQILGTRGFGHKP